MAKQIPHGTNGRPNRRRTALRVAALLLAPLGTSVGCSTMKSPASWFSKDSVATTETSPGFTSKLADTGRGITGQFKSMGSAMSSAMTKAKTAVTSTFTAKTEDGSDPLSLANIPNSVGPEVWVTQGQLAEAQGNQVKALDMYTKALEKEPNNSPALLSTARLYAKQGQHDQAIGFYQKAVSVSAEPATYNELGLAFQQAGKAAEAQSALQQAIQMDPQNVKFRNNLAGLMVSSGRSDEAVRQLEQVLPPAVAQYNVAFLNFSNRNYPAAQQYLSGALQADPNLEPARELMARLGGSQSTQTAMAAYGTAKQIYQTAQGIANPSVPSQTAQLGAGQSVTTSTQQPTTQQPGTQTPAAQPQMLAPVQAGTGAYPSLPQYPGTQY